MSEFTAGFTNDVRGRRLHLNEHPWGPAPEVLEAVAAAATQVHRYPDPDCRDLLAALSNRYGIPSDMLLVANGVDEMLLLIALAFLATGDSAVTCSQTFPGYATTAQLLGADVIRARLDDMRVSLDELERVRGSARLVYVCNPHNPTGTMCAPGELAAFAGRCADDGALVVIDEAYAEFAEPDPRLIDAVREGLRAVVLRTFSKAHALGGLRLGWAAAPTDVIVSLRRVHRAIPFSVNCVAQAAGLAALESGETHLRRTRESTTRAKLRLYERLNAIGTDYLESQANFVLVKTETDSTRLAADMLASSGVMVRDLGPLFEIPGAIRVTCCTTQDADCSADALATALRSSHRSNGVSAATNKATNTAIRCDPPSRLTTKPLSATQVFNSYLAANSLFALHELGVLGRLLEHELLDLDEFACEAGVDYSRVRALVDLLERLSYLTTSDSAVALTPAGRELVEAHGFFTWIVGGYSSILREMAALALGDKRLGTDIQREDRYVAEAGMEIDRVARVQDAITAELRTIRFESVVDLGCGNMDRMIAIAREFPHVHGCGIDMSSDACAMARSRLTETKLENRLEIVRADVLELLAAGQPWSKEADVVVSFFMLHDLFARREPVCLLGEIRDAFPAAKWFLFGDTTQHQLDGAADPPIFSLGFELLHAFMDVPVRPRATYDRAFLDAGFRILSRRTLGVPSTFLYLLGLAPSGR